MRLREFVLPFFFIVTGLLQTGVTGTATPVLVSPLKKAMEAFDVAKKTTEAAKETMDEAVKQWVLGRFSDEVPALEAAYHSAEQAYQAAEKERARAYKELEEQLKKKIK
jgi:hypothetical protein